MQLHAAVETAAPPPHTAAPTPAPATPPVSEASAAPGAVTSDDGDSVVPPVASPPFAAPVNEPPGWPAVAAVPAAPPAAAPPAAAPTAAAPIDRVPARSVEPAPPPAPAPTVEATQPQLDAASEKHLPARTPGAARNAEFAEPSNHVPALLGAVSALVIIIIGSFAGRLLTNRPRQRPQVKARPRHWPSPVSSMEDESPGIVPVMPGSSDIAHETSSPDAEALASPDGWGVRRSQVPRRVAPPQPRRAAPPPETRPSRQSTRVLEENVRELLHRLQMDLRGQPAAPATAAAAPAHVPTTQELDAVLAIWRAKRGG